MNGGPKTQDTKNNTRRANEQEEYTPQQIYDCVIFELAIRAFVIQSGWRDAFERQREYTRRDLFMGKLNVANYGHVTILWSCCNSLTML
jgi:hypothetical protein